MQKPYQLAVDRVIYGQTYKTLKYAFAGTTGDSEKIHHECDEYVVTNIVNKCDII
jgi:hypothetical protein